MSPTCAKDIVEITVSYDATGHQEDALGTYKYGSCLMGVLLDQHLRDILNNGLVIHRKKSNFTMTAVPPGP